MTLKDHENNTQKKLKKNETKKLYNKLNNSLDSIICILHIYIKRKPPVSNFLTFVNTFITILLYKKKEERKRKLFIERK